MQWALVGGQHKLNVANYEKLKLKIVNNSKLPTVNNWQLPNWPGQQLLPTNNSSNWVLLLFVVAAAGQVAAHLAGQCHFARFVCLWFVVLAFYVFPLSPSPSLFLSLSASLSVFLLFWGFFYFAYAQR